MRIKNRPKRYAKQTLRKLRNDIPIAILIANELINHRRVVVEISAKAYVFDARHEKSFSSDVTDRVLRAFHEQNIPIPGNESPSNVVQAPSA